MLAIIGGGGHAKCAYDCLQSIGYNIVGFYDDDCSLHGKILIDGKKIIGSPDEIILNNKIDKLFIAIGDNKVRLEYYEYYKQKGYRFPNAMHKGVHISKYAFIGEAVFMIGAAIINADSHIGDLSIINTSATIGHDCFLSNVVQIGPGVNIAGGCKLNEGVLVGIGAKIGPGVTIGEWTVVGAGSIVLNDLPSNSFCVGIPAKPVNKTNNYDSFTFN